MKPNPVYERAYTGQPIDVFDPRMLVRNATPKAVPGGYAYKGVVTLGKLGVASVSRNWWLRTVDFLGGGEPKLGRSYDTRYRDWGLPPVITVPPADQVIDERDW
ncbi:hypothetical protein [Herbidospora daliensis]|uniref:hypothetical protein n=1 Tax=Herbidospora daliensis TaxID=295585 RepID=UPI00078601F7|nr:hypothetical protein [Herbidospora daliensis]